MAYDVLKKNLTSTRKQLEIYKAKAAATQVSAQQQKQPAEDEVSSTCTVLHCACSDADCTDGI